MNDFNENDFLDSGDFEEIETLVMTDEEGNDTEYVIIDSIDHKGSTFLLVVETAMVEDDEADAIVLKQVGEDEENYRYEEPTDEEFEEIVRLLNEQSNEYDIEI